MENLEKWEGSFVLRPGRIEAAYVFAHIEGTFICPRHEPTLNSDTALPLPVGLIVLGVWWLRQHLDSSVVCGEARETY